jgi:hypothetical protein
MDADDDEIDLLGVGWTEAGCSVRLSPDVSAASPTCSERCGILRAVRTNAHGLRALFRF